METAVKMLFNTLSNEMGRVRLRAVPGAVFTPVLASPQHTPQRGSMRRTEDQGNQGGRGRCKNKKLMEISCGEAGVG